jgi:hypothetical protein
VLIYRLLLPGHHVKFAFNTCTSHTTQDNRRIVPIFWFEYEQIGLHICAKLFCDRSCIFEIIDQKACRSYGEQDSRLYVGRFTARVVSSM